MDDTKQNQLPHGCLIGVANRTGRKHFFISCGDHEQSRTKVEVSKIFTSGAPHSKKYRFSGGKAVLYSSKSGTFPIEKYRFSFYQPATT